MLLLSINLDERLVKIIQRWLCIRQKGYHLQYRGWNRDVRHCRRVVVAKRREGNTGEVHGSEGKSVGDNTLFLTGLASLEPLRATQHQSQAILDKSQFSSSACPK